ncbi:MAG: methyltransferase domain-containing protein [Patescibacteria group bacterium]
MDIKRTDLVLEIGSGNNPNRRADILCDRFITSSHERAGGFSVVIDRPMVVADGMRLPFRDKTFDYVIASHIFEHMEDPAGFAREIMRVGKSGFIEVPSAISERVFGWDFHHWYCGLHGGVLTFTPKRKGERFGGFFHRLIAQSLWFRKSFEAHEDEWYTRMTWRNNIPLTVSRVAHTRASIADLDKRAWKLLAEAQSDLVIDFIFSCQFLLRRFKRKTYKLIRLGKWEMKKLFDARGVVYALSVLCVCPACHGHLIEHGKKIQCEGCKAMYVVDGVIPILLSSREKKKGW